MTTLERDTKATLIHGVTGQEVEDCVLDAGTEYEYEGIGEFGLFGERYATILVDGYRYRVLAEHVVAEVE